MFGIVVNFSRTYVHQCFGKILPVEEFLSPWGRDKALQRQIDILGAFARMKERKFAGRGEDMKQHY